MNVADFRFAFRIVGKTCEPRRLVDAGAAFAAYAACSPKAELQREAYLSAFVFAADFADHLKATGSTAEFSGQCWSPWLWWDIDAQNLEQAQADSGALVEVIAGRYAIAADGLLVFFSGSKGFHLGLPTSLWSPAPSADFAKTAKRFAEHIADLAAVTIDRGVYDRVRAFRAPNSRHAKTGAHKRRLSFAELSGPLEAILELAQTPAPFVIPASTGTNETAIADWQAAADQVRHEGEAKAARRAAGNGSPTLNRSTVDFIREGAANGDRHRLLFSAAANLAEFACPPALAVALLEESALDSGLSPKDVRRQIECGLAAGPATTPPDTAVSTNARLDGSTTATALSCNTGDSGGFSWQSGQQVTPATDTAPAAALQTALARLWGSTPAPKADQGQGETMPQSPALDGRSSPAPTALSVLPPDPPKLTPLPARAVGSGKLDTPCRCGSTEFAEIAITEDRTRRDCRECGRFIGWGRWYDGGPAT